MLWMDSSGYVKKERRALSALSCLGKQIIPSRFAGVGAAVPSRCLLPHLQTHISSLQLKFQSQAIISQRSLVLVHQAKAEPWHADSNVCYLWKALLGEQNTFTQPRKYLSSPFTIHLPANIPMTTRERMITSKVFASSEVPMRIAAAMEKRLFISKVPFLQRKGKEADSVGHFWVQTDPLLWMIQFLQSLFPWNLL